MLKRMATWGSVATVLAFSGAVQAESLASKKGREDALKQAQHEIDGAKAKCGTEIKLTFDWETFDFSAVATPIVWVMTLFIQRSSRRDARYSRETRRSCAQMKTHARNWRPGREGTRDDCQAP